MNRFAESNFLCSTPLTTSLAPNAVAPIVGGAFPVWCLHIDAGTPPLEIKCPVRRGSCNQQGSVLPDTAAPPFPSHPRAP